MDLCERERSQKLSTIFEKWLFKIKSSLIYTKNPFNKCVKTQILFNKYLIWNFLPLSEMRRIFFQNYANHKDRFNNEWTTRTLYCTNSELVAFQYGWLWVRNDFFLVSLVTQGKLEVNTHWRSYKFHQFVIQVIHEIANKSIKKSKTEFLFKLK